MKAKRRLLKVPQAPDNLFCQIRTRIKRRPGALNMRWWHGRQVGTFYKMIYEIEEIGCATMHCLAGWITFLTPGGIELEAEVKKRINKRQSLYLTPSVNRYIGEGFSETSIAALLILHKAGWNYEIDGTYFTTTWEHASHIIEKLAELEKEKKRAARARAA